MPASHAPATPPLPRRFRLGEWVVDARAAQLKRGTETVRLEPKVMGVLRHLAAHAGEVVSRDELLDAVWPDVIVTENVLSRCISELRRALEDNPRAPTLIETIPKTGYRLLLPIEPVEVLPLPGTLMGDGVPALADIASPTLPPKPTAPARRLSRGWLMGILCLALLMVLGLGLFLRSEMQEPAVFVAGTPRPVTAQEGSEGLAAVSPTGDRVAYVRFVEGGQTGHIEIVGTTGGTPLPLTQSQTDTYPVFSPDGQHLAFLRCERERCRPYRISALGTDERPLADVTAHPSGLAWSPDGRFLAFVEQDSETTARHLALLNLETGQTRRLTTPPATTVGDIFPAFSPDSRQVAFVRRTDAVTGELFMVLTEGGEPVALSSDQSQIARLSWFPEGRTILASSDRDGMFRLWRFSTEGDPPTPLPLEATRPIGPTLTREGDRLVVEAWDLPIQLWSYTFYSTEDPPRQAFAPSTRRDQMPALAPDARRAVFVSTRTGYPELWIARLDGSPPRPLTTLAGPAVHSPQWSPDGRQIAFLMRLEDQYDVYTLPAEGGVPQRLTYTDANEVHPRWSPDSRAIFVGRRLDERWEGVRLAADGSTATVIVPDGVVLAASSDGRTLWYARENTPGLWALPLGTDGQPEPGSAAARRVPDLAPEDVAAWSVVHDGLVYVRRVGDRMDLVRWSDGRSEPLLLGPLNLDLWAPALAIAQDGSMALLAQMGLPKADILIADLERR